MVKRVEIVTVTRGEISRGDSQREAGAGQRTFVNKLGELLLEVTDEGRKHRLELLLLLLLVVIFVAKFDAVLCDVLEAEAAVRRHRVDDLLESRQSRRSPNAFVAVGHAPFRRWGR